MINTNQLREYIIRPALSKLSAYSRDAEELIVFTCAVESSGGEYIRQVKGPALGIYQCEPATYTDMWQNYIFHKTRLTSILSLQFAVNGIPEAERLVYDLHYATAMCRIHYLRVKEKLPSGAEPEEMYAYYKNYYNTPLGKSTKGKSIDAYKRCTQGSTYAGAKEAETDATWPPHRS
jgi:hypothetical protein